MSDNSELLSPYEDDFKELLRPEDDRAWKLAMGRAQREQIGRLTSLQKKVDTTNGRVRELEMWKGQVKAVIGTLMAVLLPTCCYVAATLIERAI